MNDSRKISYQSLKEKLSDNQLKRIIAGSDGGGTCAAINPSGNTFFCGLTKAEAIFFASCEDLVNGKKCHGGHWCFDSCSPEIWWYCG